MSILLSLVSHLGNFTGHSNFTGELERDSNFLFFFCFFFLYLVTKIFPVPCMEYKVFRKKHDSCFFEVDTRLPSSRKHDYGNENSRELKYHVKIHK